jgi:hypothetical protein
MRRTALALLLASAVATTLALLPLLAEKVGASAFMTLVMYAMLGIAPAFALVGGTLLLVFRHLQLFRLWHFLVAGAIVWSFGVVIAVAANALPNDAIALAASLLAVLAGFSTLWFIAVRSAT